VADACTLLTSVIGRVERGGRSWLFLDAGCYNGLFEAMAYQGSTRYQVNSLRRAEDGTTHVFALAGPTGDAPDVITREVVLPSDLNTGDRLFVRNVGAYSQSVTSDFNGFPKPATYLT
jgi:ornithine decarboxylase